MDKQRELIILSFFMMILLALLNPINIYAQKEVVKERTIELPKEMYGKEKADEIGEVVRIIDSDFTLEGLVDSAQFYYEVPVGGLKAGNYLNIHAQYSELLLEGSTLTISIDEQPIKSIKLLPENTDVKVKVPLEGEAIEQGFHNVTISFYGHLTENICVNEENPANWLMISESSYLFLNTNNGSGEREDVLADYPYPFVQNNRDDAAQSVIVIPNEPSTAILSAAAKLSSYLNKQISSTEKVEILLEDKVKEVTKNIIAVGSNDDWTGVMKDLAMLAEINVIDDKLLLSHYFVTGPENSSKRLLFVTATNDLIIEDKISILTDSHFIDQLTGSELLISELPQQEKKEMEQKVPFEEIGIADQTITGKSRNSLNFFYNIPTYVDVHHDASLHLKLKVAETLFVRENDFRYRDDAELVIYINDVPHSVAIHDLKKEEYDSIYHVDVPVEAELLRKAPYLSIQFQGNGLRDRDFCVPPTDEEWIFIQDDSYLHVPILQKKEYNTFQSWPAPFVSTDGTVESTIIVPDEINNDFLTQLQILTDNLGERAPLDGLRFIFEGDIIESNLTEQHIILLGSLDTYKEYNDELLIQEDAEGSLNVAKFSFINETSERVAWIQPSVWNDNKSMAVFAAVNPEETKTFLSGQILDFINTNTKLTNVVVESSRGEIFSHRLEEDEKVEERDEPPQKLFGEQVVLDTWMMYAFAGVIFVGIVIFILFLRRGKNKKVEKPKGRR